MDRYKHLLLDDDDDLDSMLSLEGPIIFSQFKTNSNSKQQFTQGTDLSPLLDPEPDLNFSANIISKQPLDFSVLNSSGLESNQNESHSATFCSANTSNSYLTLDLYKQQLTNNENLSALTLSEISKNATTTEFVQSEFFETQDAEIRDVEMQSNNSDIRDSGNLSFGGADPIIISIIPKTILNLYQTIRTSLSDFSFIYAISAQLCQDIMPMESYVEFKIGLLLSLASIQANGTKPPLSIVAIGQNTSFANLLMSQIGNLANRLITPMDKFETAVLQHENMIDSCPLLLARGGVYYLGDWSCLKPATAGKVLRDITCGYVSIDKAPINYPVHSAIWCYWKNYKNNLNDLKTFSTFLKVFGIPLFIEDSTSDILIDFILEQATTDEFNLPKDELSISFDAMKQFISIVSKLPTKMSSDSADLLQKYFIASRLDRPECLTEKAYSALTQMSESFAKLSLRDQIQPNDIIGAIYMTEYFIKNIFGPGIFPPPTLFAGNNIENVETFFNEFKIWIYAYVEKFSNNNNNKD